jgi:hypothetical protein
MKRAANALRLSDGWLAGHLGDAGQHDAEAEAFVL